jgi:hypothetical protein
MFFDGHDRPLFPDARGEVGRNVVDGQHPHTPYLDVVEQFLITHIVQVAHNRSHANDNTSSPRLSLRHGAKVGTSPGISAGVFSRK